jgi:ribonuclease T1
MVRSGAFKLALTGVLLVSAVWWTGLQAKEVLPADRGSVVAFNSLPAQGQETYQLIRQGGPFPYEKDGVVFGNRERLLPQQKRGFYREYTVKTPGSGDRGARRIVCGGEVKTPRACYYSDDHYASFRKIVP